MSASHFSTVGEYRAERLPGFLPAGALSRYPRTFFLLTSPEPCLATPDARRLELLFFGGLFLSGVIRALGLAREDLPLGKAARPEATAFDPILVTAFFAAFTVLEGTKVFP